MITKLTPERLDGILERPRLHGDRIIWTLAAIGGRIGVGADFVRDVLAKVDGSPIREIGGKYYCFEEDLIDFLRKPRETA